MQDDKTEDQEIESEEPEEPEGEPTEEQEPVVEEEEQEPEVEEEPEPEPPSRRENKRIAELTKKLQANREEFNPEQRSNPDKPPIIGEGDYDLEQVNDIAKKYADERYSEGLAQANAISFQTRLEIDAPKVATKYEWLDPESDNFDPGRAAFTNELYLRTVGYNPKNGHVSDPTLRYSEFVEGVMELVDNAVASKAVDSQKNITEQVAKAGLRPSGTAKKEYSGTNPAQMSDAQLDAMIASALPKK